MPIASLRILAFINGIFLVTLALSMLVPVITLLIFEQPQKINAFLWSSLITALVGLTMIAQGRPQQTQLRPRDMYMLTVSSWVMVSVFAALPFIFAERASITDAYFESMSGITATGATVFSGLDDMSPGTLIWRSLLHWLGGIGFIGMAVAILPILRIGGMRLFQTESSDRSEKVMPRSHMVAKYMVLAYLGLSSLAVLAFWLAGMGLFDSINHAMSAIATGGFSTSDASLGKWQAPAIHWVAIVVMVLGSLPFVLYVSALRGNYRALLRDAQVQGFLLLLVSSWFVLAGWKWLTTDLYWLDALRLVAVNITSIMTTTGFAVGGYHLWGPFASMMFFYLTFVGGCSGSTAGGLKIFRFQVAYILLKANLKQLIHPRAVIKQQYNRHRLDEDIVRSILAFAFFYTITIAALALGVAMCGVDWITALTGAAAMVSGVGPGMGEMVGPAGNYATIPDLAKWLLSFGMLLGRLEILTVLVLLFPAFWRH
ncbi:MAG: TrkH family potassium uptake protein [Pseudomonas sp.]|nr:TrkH family potassium uptake protein [Pseudomonas sp.]